MNCKSNSLDLKHYSKVTQYHGMGLFRLAQNEAFTQRRESSFCHVALARPLGPSLAQLLLLPGMNYRKLLFTLLHSKDNSTKKLTKAVRNFLTWTTVKEYNVVLQGKVIKIMSKSPSSSNHHKYKSKLSTGSFKGKFTYQDPATHHTVLVLP